MTVNKSIYLTIGQQTSLLVKTRQYPWTAMKGYFSQKSDFVKTYKGTPFTRMMMMSFYERAAENLLELASDQRLEILFRLLEQNSKTTQMANIIGSTKQEVHRHLARLLNSGLISKDGEGGYHISTFGKTMCTQIPTLTFFAENKKYFQEHYFVDVPEKLVMRIGQLRDGQHLKGVTKVFGQCESIYNNAEEHIYEVLAELSLDRIPIVFGRVKKRIRLSYIVSDSAIVPKGRREALEKVGIRRLMDKGLIERRMKKTVQTMVVLNEKEACVMFPETNGEADFTEAFYSDKEPFHEWCLDYFRYCWQNSGFWVEGKLRE